MILILELANATTFLGPPLHEAYMDVSSGREAYEKKHIQGAVFADLYKDFTEQDQNYPTLIHLERNLSIIFLSLVLVRGLMLWFMIKELRMTIQWLYRTGLLVLHGSFAMKASNR